MKNSKSCICIVFLLLANFCDGQTVQQQYQSVKPMPIAYNSTQPKNSMVRTVAPYTATTRAVAPYTATTRAVVPYTATTRAVAPNTVATPVTHNTTSVTPTTAPQVTVTIVGNKKITKTVIKLPDGSVETTTKTCYYSGPAVANGAVSKRIPVNPKIERAVGVGYFCSSPNGNRVAYSTEVLDPNTGQSLGKDLFFANADGSNPYNASNGAYTAEDLAWSPDGTKLAITRLSANTKEIWLMMGSTSRKLIAGSKPVWSPDSRFILFRPPNPNFTGFTVIDVNGRNFRSYNLNLLGDSSPYWSPDGTKILFAQNGKLWNVNLRSEIVLAEAENTK